MEEEYQEDFESSLMQDLLNENIANKDVSEFVITLKDKTVYTGKPYLDDLRDPEGVIQPKISQSYIKSKVICIVTKDYGPVKFPACHVFSYHGI